MAPAPVADASVAATPTGQDQGASPAILSTESAIAEVGSDVSPTSGVPLTSTDEDLDATVVVSKRKRAQSPWSLVLPDGKTCALESVTLIGRDARPRAKWPGAQLLSVDDPTKSVSKTHAIFEADESQLWVTDLKSTNGVIVKFPDGNELDGDDGSRVQIQPGSSITLGSYVIQVEKG